MSTGLTETKNRKTKTTETTKTMETTKTLKKTTSVEFPQKDELYEKRDKDCSEYNEYGASSNQPDTYGLSEEEFNPHNVAGSPPNAFISTLKQRMDCYFSPNY